MDEIRIASDPDSDHFVDAPDELPPPPPDLGDSPTSSFSDHHSPTVTDEANPFPNHSPSTSTTLRRRRSSSISARRKISPADAGDSSLDRPPVSEISHISDAASPPDSADQISSLAPERSESQASGSSSNEKFAADDSIRGKYTRRKISFTNSDLSSLDCPTFSEIVQISDAVPDQKNRISSSSLERTEPPPLSRLKSDPILPRSDRNGDQIDKSAADDAHLGNCDGDRWNPLVWMVESVIRVIGFQISLLISLITFPFWLINFGFGLVSSPFCTVRQARATLNQKFFNIFDNLSVVIGLPMHRLSHNFNSLRKCAGRIGWGCLWAMYVCFVLSSVLVSSFLMGGIIMSNIVEEPIQMNEVLNFDYTMANPVAFVPMPSCDDLGCAMVGCGVKLGAGNRIILPHHQLQVTVLLTLPESDHNRNLGVFQHLC